MAEHDREVRSPWSSGGQNAEPGPNTLTQAGIYRTDQGGHLANHVGKNARTNPRLRADFGPANEPVQGGRRNVIE